MTVEGARPRRRKRLFLIILAALIGPLAVGLAGLYFYLHGGRYVTTENAYVKTEKIAISADISGRVGAINVAENRKVQKNQLLFTMDDQPLRLSLAQENARIDAVRQDILAVRASYRQKLADLALARGDVEFYQTRFDRQKKLQSRGIVSQSRLDEYQNSLRASRDRVASVRQDIQQVLASLGGDPNKPPEQQPRYLVAQANRDLVALDLKRTEVRSPAAGIVTNFNLEVGEYIEVGRPVFSLVSDQKVWLQANIKETDLTHVRQGQLATVRFDAYPDVRAEAVVDGIAPATGAEFALLPPQNASGNWVKVVQRLPVRLHLQNVDALPQLRAGMSAMIEIDTGHERRLPPIAQSAVAWVRSRR